MTTSPRQRTAGAVLLVLAALGVGVTAPLAHHGVDGRPKPAVVPSVPGDGDCVTDRGATTVVVDCATPHTAQVVRAWSAFDRAVAAAPADVSQDCWRRGRDVLGPLGLARDSAFDVPVPTAGWGPPPVTVDTGVVADTDDPGTRTWVACVVRPRSTVGADVNTPLAEAGLFSGAIGDLVPLAGRPVSLRVCYEDATLLPAAVDCRAFHRGEVLAARAAPTGTGADDPATCTAIAASVMATADPGHGGILTVRVDSRPAAGQFGRTATPPGTVLLRCVVEVTSGGFLTDSVVGLGDAPPPVR